MACAVVTVVASLVIVSVDARRAAAGHQCENSTIASPRTLKCSAKSEETLQQWHTWQRQLAAEAAGYHRPRSLSEPPRLLFVGDSITEALRGTAIGVAVARTVGIDAVLNSTPALSSYGRPLVLAISADQTQHLLWRLRTELASASPELRSDDRLLINLLIGTNNLGNAHQTPLATAQGVLAVVESILSLTQGKLLVNLLLPRGDNEVKQKRTPSLMPAIRHANQLIATGVDALRAGRFPRRVNAVDCGRGFLPEQPSSSTSSVRLDLMPDGLHPNVEGSRVWVTCFARAFGELQWR